MVIVGEIRVGAGEERRAWRRCDAPRLDLLLGFDEDDEGEAPGRGSAARGRRCPRQRRWHDDECIGCGGEDGGEGESEWSGRGKWERGSRGRELPPLSPPGAARERGRWRPWAQSGAPEEEGRGAPGAVGAGPAQVGLAQGKGGALSFFSLRFFCFLLFSYCSNLVFSFCKI